MVKRDENMQHSQIIQTFDNNPHLAQQMNLMTGSQLHYAQKQRGVIDNTINPNALYDGTITQITPNQYQYHQVKESNLNQRLHQFLVHQYQQIKNKQPKQAKILKEDVLVKQNRQEWNKINDYINHSNIKNKGIGVNQFNAFSSHNMKPQDLNKQIGQPKKHHIRDAREAYDDTSFGKDAGTAVATKSLKPTGIVSHGVARSARTSLLGGLKTLALHINPEILSGIMVAKQLKNKIEYHQGKNESQSSTNERQWKSYIKRIRKQHTKGIVQSKHLSLPKSPQHQWQNNQHLTR